MKVVVVGAGYAGMMAANKLARKARNAEITVINPRPQFVERVRLHQRIAATTRAARPFSAMLRKGIRSRVGTVDKIGDGTVVLDDGARFDFDHAILAVGSTVRPMPGTVPVGSWDGAEAARRSLAALGEGATVTVIGAGPTGIETASEIASTRPELRVRLIGAAIAHSYSLGARERVLTELERMNVDLVEDSVTEVTDGVVRLESGDRFRSDLSLWAVISGVPQLASRSGLAVNEDGQVIVDAYLRSVSDDRIFAVGDCAAVPGARFSCQCAIPQGGYVGGACARLLRGRELEPFVMRFRGRGVSLGRRDAVVQFTDADDNPKESFAAGATGVALKELATRGAKFGAGTGWGA
ncbi:NAD(P)/FAD-dependent oxidoreductase [Stackebrandtia nassauensis]|uniref:FAD-dependent pyridine nucleotide-disulfide oxidoreductase n=1 Tax=Stackebrandtia nassauensis (strain DSM 44728 / CIP 108903 / NRRL B-16338 / NBRC 102104 / LLR-40K-21) TaxID=446470 RepID=D3Q0D3_STANL|nr:FAD-dependent oxidoreductase [Stackebrandtia nassauensis]ADD39797.1 FAD-dependent pyridine nucleotide-disulfide oxidoreductase [Stackebrandtia nassauensis DSM 44728]